MSPLSGRKSPTPHDSPEIPQGYIRPARFFFPGRYIGVYISLRCLLTEQPNVYRADGTRHSPPYRRNERFSDFSFGGKKPFDRNHQCHNRPNPIIASVARKTSLYFYTPNDQPSPIAEREIKLREAKVHQLQDHHLLKKSKAKRI